MNCQQAIKFLKSNQPMPSDSDITQEACDSFIECMRFFAENPEPDCVMLLINSVSENNGLGMYEMISDVLTKQERSVVLFCLKKALNEGCESLKYRSCWWAIDLNAWCLINEIKPLSSCGSSDVSYAANAFMELRCEHV